MTLSSAAGLLQAELDVRPCALMSADATRLLVLGATRQEGSATGYAIMRELISWGVEDWASVNPGSIYGALRALAKEGLLVEDSEPPAAGGRSRRNSKRYRLTDEGSSAFTDLLRRALWEVDPYQGTPFLAALCFLVDLTRDEVLAAIEERITRLDSLQRQLSFDEKQTVLDTAKRPPHSVEFVRLATARLDGERTFTGTLLDRIRNGAYTFAGDG